MSRSSTEPASTAGDTSGATVMPADRMTADASSAMSRAGEKPQSRAGDAPTSPAPGAATGPAARPSADGIAETARKAEGAAGDAALTARVKTKLMAEPGIDSLSIDVDSKASTVTLSGEVDSAAERTRVTEIARSTEGVTEVVDQLQVKQ